jgi:hypothetical protein
LTAWSTASPTSRSTTPTRARSRRPLRSVSQAVLRLCVTRAEARWMVRKGWCLTPFSMPVCMCACVQMQAPKGSKKKVKVSIVESFTKDVEPKDLEATLRMEYRTKLLNPKWAKAMASQVRA